VNILSGLLYRLQKAALALQLGCNLARVNARYNTLSDAQKVRFYESYCQPLCAAELAEKSLRNALAPPTGG